MLTIKLSSSQIKCKTMYYFKLISVSLVVNASLNEVSYTVNEEEGFGEGCVVLDGLIQRDVVIQLSTVDATATSIYYVILISN